MRVLNLVNPALGDVKYTIEQYNVHGDADVSVNIDLDPKKLNHDTVTVFTRLASPKDFTNLALVLDVLNRNEIRYEVAVSYLLGARADRLFSPTSAVNLKVYVNLLKSMGLTSIRTLDVHSPERIEQYGLKVDNKLVFTEITEAAVLYPDGRTVESVDPKIPAYHCIKSRSGDNAINQIIIPGEVLTYPSIRIIDDLVDGGGSVRLILDQLTKMGYKGRVTLQFTHCIQPERLIGLKNHNLVSDVIVTDSYLSAERDVPLLLSVGVKVLQAADYLY